MIKLLVYCMFIFLEASAPPSNIIILNVTSTYASISWQPPSIWNWNGILTGYIIQITRQAKLMAELVYDYDKCLLQCDIFGNNTNNNCTHSKFKKILCL